MARQLPLLLVPWREQYFPTLPFSVNHCCPHCKVFSYFCNGKFEGHNALDWIQAVGGYNKWHSTVIIDCPECGNPFNLIISSEVVPYYKDHCSRWPK